MSEYAVMPKADYQDACDAVREKTGGTALIKSGELGGLIREIKSGSENVKAQAKTATPSATADQVIMPDDGYNYLTQVTVQKIPYTETPNAAGGTTVTIG